MSLLDKLSDRETWERFYAYKTSLACPRSFEKELRSYIDGGAYLPVCDAIAQGEPFPLPKKAVISKLSTGKKRTVYTYPFRENVVLKLLTYLLLRRYDGIFADNLYSFRPGRSAKDAVRRLIRTPDLMHKYAYKVDIHNYFNSVPVDRLLPMLESVTRDDPRLFTFLRRLLEEERVRDGGRIITEEKGIMAGTPLSAFYANLFLRDLDALFEKKGVPYARYSDDIILFADSSEEVGAYARLVRDFLAERQLEVNPDKEEFFDPTDGFVFLGFSYRERVIDIAPATLKKLKQKMRRKANALRRWRDRNGLDGQQAAKAFIRIFNRKLLEHGDDHELTWSYWFFSVINTTDSLHEIDLYAQDCLRYLISGTHTKARFNVRYDDLKALGYRSLVNAYYAFEGEERRADGETL